MQGKHTAKSRATYLATSVIKKDKIFDELKKTELKNR
jgi:hypothetical protein